MEIRTFNEFCYLLWYFAPIAYDAHLKGEVVNTTSRIGTSPLFYFSDKHTETRKHRWKLRRHGAFKYRDEFYKYEVPKIKNWQPPPYKEKYKNDILIYEKPILTINNKCSIEFEKGLFNYFDTESLKKIFDAFGDTHQIIYIRHPNGQSKSYQHDTNNKVKDIGDFNLIKSKYPGIITINDLLNDHPDKGYNELQMMALANSEKHICSAGGEAAIASYFGGDVLIYRNPTVHSTSRKVWHTGSYLKVFSGANIFGFTDYDELLSNAKKIFS